MLQFLKLWWMGYWRLGLYFAFVGFGDSSIPFFASLVAAFILRFIKGLTIRTWPMIRLFKRENPVINLRRRSSRFRPQTQTRTLSTADNQYEAGAMTGYEPQRLDNVALRFARRMYGNPGAGLSSSNFSDTSIELGQRGEVNFAKALSIALHRGGSPIIDTTDTLWSIAMPSKRSAYQKDWEYKSDIDCIIVGADTIYLLDVKFYASGNVAYRTRGNFLECIDLETGLPAAASKTMSKNMEMAQDRFANHFPDMRVISRVVFMPTEKGAPQLDNVRWPGGIPAVGLMGILDELSKMKPAPQRGRPADIVSQIKTLVKN